MPPLAEWQTFLSVQAGAAAALTGLVFVAGVSIDLGSIVSRTTMTQFSSVPFGVAGILLALRNPAGIYWPVAGDRILLHRRSEQRVGAISEILR